MQGGVIFVTGLFAVVLAVMQLYPTLKYGFGSVENTPEAMRKYPHSRINNPKAFWLHVAFLTLWLGLGLFFVGYGLTQG
jgi:hypothetical protein